MNATENIENIYSVAIYMNKVQAVSKIAQYLLEKISNTLSWWQPKT